MEYKTNKIRKSSVKELSCLKIKIAPSGDSFHAFLPKNWIQNSTSIIVFRENDLK
jgi:hypothetical protein